MQASRRNLLSRGAGAGLFGMLGIDPAQAKRDVPPVQPSEMPQLQSIMAANQVTILGDTDHSKDFYGFLGSADFLDAAKKAKVGTIAIEVDSSMQSVADDLAAGKIDRKQFRDTFTQEYYTLWPNPEKFYDNLANTVLGARDRGMRVVFADHTASMGNLLSGIVDKYSDELSKIAGCSGEKQKKLEKLFVKKHEKEIESLFSGVYSERTSTQLNNGIATIIEQDSQRGYNTLVMFGAEHARYLQTDFQKAGLKTAVVVLHADRQSYQDNLRSTPEVGYGKINDFLIDTQRFANMAPIVPSPRATAAPASVPTPKQQR